MSKCVCVCLKASMPGFGRALNRIRFKWIGEGRRGVVARSKAVKSVLWGPSPDNMSQLKLQNRTALKNVFIEMGLK